MSDRVKNIFQAAMLLDESERAELAQMLLQTIDDEEQIAAHLDFEAEWIAEVQHRLATLDESKLIPGDTAMKMAKARQMP